MTQQKSLLIYAGLLLTVLAEPLNARYGKPMVSEWDYMCALGTHFNVTCDQIWRSHEPYEAHKSPAQATPAKANTYVIEPNTHRSWLTSPLTPKEVPLEKLGYYEKSLKWYK